VVGEGQTEERCNWGREGDSFIEGDSLVKASLIRWNYGVCGILLKLGKRDQKETTFALESFTSAKEMGKTQRRGGGRKSPIERIGSDLYLELGNRSSRGPAAGMHEKSAQYAYFGRKPEGRKKKRMQWRGREDPFPLKEGGEGGFYAVAGRGISWERYQEDMA